MQQNKASVWLIVMREARNLSQRGLATRVGMPNTTISKAESGEASPDTWIRLAEHFRMSADSVLWLAGLFKPPLPPKDEIIDKINFLIDEMEPDTRKMAEQLIEWIKDDP